MWSLFGRQALYAENINFQNRREYYIELGVTIARKVLPHPQGIKDTMQNLLNNGLLYDPVLPGRDARQDYFDVLLVK
jgi:hypothetical protein